MHPEARSFINSHAGRFHTALEFGGRNVNGTVSDLFDVHQWVSIDLLAGPGVDIVADARTWQPLSPVDLVVCCEVAEHCPDAHLLIRNAVHCLKPGGLFLYTAACSPRAPHSGLDGGVLRPGEFYRNVDPEQLRDILRRRFSTSEVEVHPDRGDVYAAARR